MVDYLGCDHPQHITRRDALKAGTGLGAAAMAVAAQPAATFAADEKRGGHLVVLNYAYPEVWDPHIAGTLGALGSISPVYNQVVEFNPLKPDEVIGDLAKSWEVKDDGPRMFFICMRASSGRMAKNSRRMTWPLASNA